MHALWVLVSKGGLSTDAHDETPAADDDPAFRAWGVRAAGNSGEVDPEVRDQIAALAADPSRDVQLQVAIAARKIEGLDPVATLATVTASLRRR